MLARFSGGNAMAHFLRLVPVGRTAPETIGQIEAEAFETFRRAGSYTVPLDWLAGPRLIAGATLTFGFVVVLPFFVAGLAHSLVTF